MPTIYEEYAPYRPELDAGDQEMLDTSPDRHEAEIRIGLDRAEVQLREWPYPESPDTFEKFPGIDPRGKTCDVDMGFAARFTNLQATLSVRPPEVREYISGVLETMKDHKSPLFRSWDEMTNDCIAIRQILRGAKLAPTQEASEHMLEDAAKRSIEEGSIQRIDGFLTAMEYAAGISDKVPDERARNYLANSLHAPIPERVEAVRTAPNISPAALNVHFQNFDHIVAHQFCSNPENWNKTPKDLPPDFAERDKALPIIYKYAPATVDRALQPVFERIEDMGRGNIAESLDRGGLITVDGKTVRSMMEESYRGDPKDFAGWYKENVREMTNRFVSSGLMSGKRVEALIPDAKGNIPKEPIQITKSGYEPSPLKKVTLNAWERYFARHGHYKEKAAKAAEYQRVMEGREQMRSNCLAGTLAAHGNTRTRTENLFFSEYKQELGGRTDMRLSEILKESTRDSFRLSRSAHVAACICHLAAQGHSIQDIMDPEKLQTERQAAARLYMEKSAARDTNWLGGTYFRGMDALTKQAREIIKQHDFTKKEGMLEALPKLYSATAALFDGSQEMELSGTYEGYFLAAEAEHPGKGVEYGERMRDLANAACQINDIAIHELNASVALANPTGIPLQNQVAYTLAGAGLREIIKNSSESDPLLWINTEQYGLLGTIQVDPTVRELTERLEKDPAACRATARLAQSGQFQDKVHVSVEQVLNKDGTPSVMNVNMNHPSLVRGEDGQLHLKAGSIKVTNPRLKVVVTPSKSLEARMEKQQKAHEFQKAHSKPEPKKEAPQKQNHAKGGGGRTR